MGTAKKLLGPLRGKDQLLEQCRLLQSHLSSPACQVFAAVVAGGVIWETSSYFCENWL